MPAMLMDLVKYLDGLLAIEKFHDYCPNGLQIEGCREIKKLVTGVTACQALFDRAISEKADAILVHHGFFWKEEDPRIIGIKKKRIATLIKNNVSLIAYHLPLDAHPVFGNNAQLVQKLGIELELPEKREVTDIIFVGNLAEAMSVRDFTAKVTDVLQRTPLCIADPDKKIKKIAVCSGGAQDYFNQALKYDVDAFLTGEICEYIVHVARETGVAYIAAGHHATEKYGIQTIGEHAAQKFNLEYKFIDIENPV
jgi:dinuclear metal center YbgI/SA1388 family protein